MQFKFTVNKNPVTIEFDVDTIAEGIQVLTDAAGELGRLYDDLAADGEGETVTEAPKKRRRKKGEADPATATAPPPAPVPASAPPAAPVPGVMQPPDMPAFLDRTGGATTAPAAPVAPPTPPAARLADKVIADLKTRKAGAADDGKALADWLAGAGLVAAGSTFDESIAVLQFVKDEQLQPIATALGVTT